MYLLDANVLIRANADFYALDRIPQFWEWLIGKGGNGEIKIPVAIHDEIAVGSDQWQTGSKTKSLASARRNARAGTGPAGARHGLTGPAPGLH